MDPLLSSDKLHEIRQLCEQGRKVDAIKVYRTATGLGLKESLDAVERLAAGLSMTPPPAPATSEPERPGLTPDKVAEIRGLCASGAKIPAIKLYRELTGAGLAEAKNAVEQIARNSDMPLPPSFTGAKDSSSPVVTSSGCFGVLMFGTAGLIALGVWKFVLAAT